MNKRISVLVSGATGKQGGALARTLLGNGHTVYAMTRKRSSQAAYDLEKLGAHIIPGDFDDPMELEKHARGLEVFFLMGTFLEKGPDAETKQGIAALDAVKKAGVKHIVYTSVAGANQPTGIPHFDSKLKVEQHLATLGIPYSIIAPVYFFENIISPMSLPALKERIFSFGLPASKKLQMIAVENIGAFAAHVIENRDKFAGTRTELASDELSGPEIAGILVKASGIGISFVRQQIEEIRKFSADYAKMTEWFIEKGYTVNIPLLRDKYPEIGWLGFGEWAGKQNWNMIKA
jgi:uncharacterized protein YbjT (DUF2867 family)